jgi:subtilisin family serine protease
MSVDFGDSLLENFFKKHPDAELVHKYDMESFSGFAIKAPSEEALKDLRSISEVESVEYELIGVGQDCERTDKLCREKVTELQQDELYDNDDEQIDSLTDSIQKNAPWHLWRICQREMRNLNYRYYSSSGKGVDIYLIDSGVRKSHRELRGKIVLEKNFLDTNEPLTNGHGTWVAGLAVGRKFGVAKRASILSARIMNGKGRGSESDLIAAINWAINLKKKRQNPSIINMSLGFGKSEYIARAIKAARKANILLVGAAGNDYDENACDSYPSGLNEVITVGGSDFYNRRYGAYGKCIDIFAPGTNLDSASAKDDNSVITAAGTSGSAPLVSGVIALFLSNERNYRVNEVENVLIEAATRNLLTDLGSRSPNRLLYNRKPNTELFIFEND